MQILKLNPYRYETVDERVKLGNKQQNTETKPPLMNITFTAQNQYA